jgi:hypothetical protein
MSIDAGSSSTFSPKLANACLMSSTINNILTLDYIAEVRKILVFQSTLAYLKGKLPVINILFHDSCWLHYIHPPAGYQYPATDLLGGLDAIASKVAAGGFKSQYVLDQAIIALFLTAHEGYLGVNGFCTLQTMAYSRPINFLLPSKDGTSLPLVYTLGMFTIPFR